jgi:hypothetical protein
VSYYRLLNERSVEKALTSLFSDLARSGTLDSIPDKVAAQNHAKMELSGFHLFTQGGSVKPYTWFLHKPKISILDALRIYESVAANPITELDTAGNLAGHIYPRTSDDRKMFSKFTGLSNWLSPALLFAACSQYLGVEIESASNNSVSMRLGNGMIQISPKGIWSNTRRSIVASQPDESPDKVITYFPAIATTNPVVKALWELCDGSASQYAVTTIAHALDEGVLNKSVLVRIGKLDHPLIAKARAGGRDRQRAAQALGHCDNILDSAVEDLVGSLYDAAVPDLMCRKTLQSRIPAPTQIERGRIIREDTIEAWRAWLHQYFEETFGAVA